MGSSDSKLKCANCDIPEFSLNGSCMYGKVVYVYDGDTVHIVINFKGKLTKFNCRLTGIDSPEIIPKGVVDVKLRDEEIESAYKSRDYLLSRVTNKFTDVPNSKKRLDKKEVKTLCENSSKLIYVKCYDFDKYGRLLVELYDDKNATQSINLDMVKYKYASIYNGGTKKSFNKLDFN